MKVNFNGELYQVVFTDHAKERMALRIISEDLVYFVLKNGHQIQKEKANHYWVYGSVPKRRDNFICLSIALETPFLIVVTTLINWRPK